MPSYKYRVIFEDGKVGRGRIMALNKTHAIESLKKDELQPIYIHRMRENTSKAKIKAKQKFDKLTKENPNIHIKQKEKIDFNNITLQDLKKIDWGFLKPINTHDLIIFANNFYILKKAKFNNVQALQAIYDGTENPAFKDVIEDLLIGVESGERLNTIMEAYPKVFPAMFVNFVKVGEESGTLDTALLYARDYVESSTKLRKTVRKAVIPRVLQFFGIIIGMFVMLIVGVPIIEDVYSMFDSSQQIPGATLAMLHFAQWFVNNWVIILAVLALLVIAFLAIINTPRGRYKWDKLKLTMPVIGPLLTNLTVSKFFQAMLLNLRNGMRIQESLDVSKNVTSNYYFLSAVEAGKAQSMSGGSWIEPFEEKKLFKPMVSEMVDIGMKTDLSEMMEKVNEYIKQEIDESLTKFVKWLPDITYLFVGIALIAFVIAVVVPVMQIYMGSFIDMPM